MKHYWAIDVTKTGLYPMYDDKTGQFAITTECHPGTILTVKHSPYPPYPVCSRCGHDFRSPTSERASSSWATVWTYMSQTEEKTAEWVAAWTGVPFEDITVSITPRD